jgi:hypothetical protein
MKAYTLKDLESGEYFYHSYTWGPDESKAKKWFNKGACKSALTRYNNWIASLSPEAQTRRARRDHYRIGTRQEYNLVLNIVEYLN